MYDEGIRIACRGFVGSYIWCPKKKEFRLKKECPTRKQQGEKKIQGKDY